MSEIRGYKDLVELPDYFTLGAITCGISSVFLVISGFYYYAFVFSFLNFLFDHLDGMIARIMRRKEKAFGEVLDGMGDMLSWVVFPAVFGFCFGLTNFLSILVLIIFVISGALRLARFEAIEGVPGYYIGLPSIYNSFIFITLYICLELLNLGHNLSVVIFSVTFLLSAILMSMSFKVRKF